MPSGIYQRTDKHKFNLGKKHPNRKKYFRGISIRKKICLYCNNEYIANYKNFSKSKFCSKSCSSKSRPSGMLGKKQSDKLICLLKSRTKELHPRWVKDRNMVVKSEKKHLDSNYRNWSKSVKDRDNWKCKLLNHECSGRLESHHIYRWKDYPDLRYDINNGITLCHFHHPRKRVDEDNMINVFIELLTKL